MKPGFREEQQFRSPLIWVVMSMAVLVVMWGFWEEFQASDSLHWTSFIGIGAIVLTASLLMILKLQLSLDEKHLQMRYYPFVKKDIAMSEIARLEVIDYGFVGGWGIRMFTKHGTVYNVSGSKGLKVYLKNKKTFVVGTQRENELRTFIHNSIQSSSSS